MAGSAKSKSASVRSSDWMPGILAKTGGRSTSATGAICEMGSGVLGAPNGAVALLRDGGVDSTTACNHKYNTHCSLTSIMPECMLT